MRSTHTYELDSLTPTITHTYKLDSLTSMRSTASTNWLTHTYELDSLTSIKKDFSVVACWDKYFLR